MLDLDLLVAPTTADEFLQRHWPSRPGYFDGDSERLAPVLSALPELGSGERILEVFEDRVTLLRPDGFFANVPNGAAALSFYRAEYTCFLRRVERYVPGLEQVATQMAATLGVPRDVLHCEVFTSTGNGGEVYANASGLPMHSDFEATFALLLAGRKVWRWAPNEHIRNQTATLVGGQGAQIDSAQLSLADKLPLPSEMPQDAQTAEVTAGGVIFMPRGWWHQTVAHGDCLQLNFTLKGPTWISILCDALSKRLLTDADWREYAYGVVGTEEQRSRAQEEFRKLLGGLVSDLGKDGAAEALLSSLS
jgi:hypothetical protein